MNRLEKAMHTGAGIRMRVRIVPSTAFVGDSLVVDERR